jgi:hypothetical protein
VRLSIRSCHGCFRTSTARPWRGFAFANFYHHLPGDGGPIKGFIAGVFGWLAMDLIFFPLLGLGPFAVHLGLDIWPALFSLGMMLAYSIVMGLVTA